MSRKAQAVKMATIIVTDDTPPEEGAPAVEAAAEAVETAAEAVEEVAAETGEASAVDVHQAEQIAHVEDATEDAQATADAALALAEEAAGTADAALEFAISADVAATGIEADLPPIVEEAAEEAVHEELEEVMDDVPPGTRTHWLDRGWDDWKSIWRERR